MSASSSGEDLIEALQHLAQLSSFQGIFMFHSAYFGLSSESYAPNHEC
jgi:hypothetical protein